ncbi:MAG TPA: Smr/MutS family protein [Bacteroidia bacterium]|nr:Smr/MutS family protein [Bacteroidia bacterium]
MKLQIGDKVRFLNENLEGFVVRLLSNDKVEVADADGFKHISDEKQCVRIEFQLDAELPLEPQEKPEEKEVAILPPVVKSAPRKADIIPSIEPDDTIYAALKMVQEKTPLTSEIEMILVNNTGYEVVFTVSRKLAEFRSGIDSGVLSPRTELPLGVYSPDQMHRFDGFEFQFLFFGKKEYRPRSPVIKPLMFSGSDFIDPNLKSTLRSAERPVLLMPLYSLNPMNEIDISKLLDKYQQKESEENLRSLQKTGKGRAEKFTILSRTKVVDLHIEELLKDYSGMSNAQIIAYQLNYFLYELDQAMINKVHKITFIHGVGQGVLKSAIREELKKIPFIRYGEAPPEQYGFGATEVEFL